MIDPRVYEVCEAFEVRIVDGRAYPDVRETRAVVTMDRILKRHGYEHFVLTMRTIAESNCQGHIDEYLLWAISDLVLACRRVMESDYEKWLQVFNTTPVAQLQFIARDLSGITHQRHAIAGMLYERIYRAFGPLAVQPDLFDERRIA